MSVYRNIDHVSVIIVLFCYCLYFVVCLAAKICLCVCDILDIPLIYLLGSSNILCVNKLRFDEHLIQET